METAVYREKNTLLLFKMNSSSEDEVLALMVLQRRRRRKWVHNINRTHNVHSEYHTLVRELSLYDDKFKEYFMLTREQYEDLLGLIGPSLQKKNTHYRESISPGQRLAICLRHLATGDSFKSIAFSYRLGKSTVREIVIEVCKKMWECLQPIYMPIPNRDIWNKVAQGYEEKCNFPNCIGALDGKHVTIQAPPNSGSMFFNYKKTFSIVLMALVDSDYKFLVIDVGAYGRNSDGGIFASSTLGQSLEAGTLNIPGPKQLPGAPEFGEVPHVIVGDEAFPLKPYLMRPFPGRKLPDHKKIFNYRLSRARRIVENTFGIMSSKWQIYQRRIRVDADNATTLVKATCILHNFWRSTGPNQDNNDEVVAVDALRPFHRVGNNPTNIAYGVRETFKDYFNSPAGELHFQRRIIHRGLQLQEQ